MGIGVAYCSQGNYFSASVFAELVSTYHSTVTLSVKTEGQRTLAGVNRCSFNDVRALLHYICCRSHHIWLKLVYLLLFQVISSMTITGTREHYCSLLCSHGTVFCQCYFSPMQLVYACVGRSLAAREERKTF